MSIQATDFYHNSVRKLEEFSFRMRAPDVCRETAIFKKIGDVRVDGTLQGYSSEAQLGIPTSTTVTSLDTWSNIYFKASVTSDMLGGAKIKSTVLKDVLVTPKNEDSAQDEPGEEVAIYADGSNTPKGNEVQFKKITKYTTDKAKEVHFEFLLHPNVIYANDNHKTTVIARLTLEYERDSTGRRRLMEEERVLTAEIHVRPNNSPKVTALSLEDVDFPEETPLWDSIPQGILFGTIAVLVALAGYLIYKLQRQSQSKNNVKYNLADTLEETAAVM